MDPSPKTGVRRVVLCGVQGCCPTVDVYDDENKVVISDDEGGQVTLTKEQWKEARDIDA